MDFIYNMFVSLCLLLDNVIYKINTLLFSIFVELSDLKFTDSVFSDFAQRIYVIIGVFMMFKVAFSLLQMLTNPDLLADKEKGAGKLATRIVIALSLIIAVPIIFNIALQLQGAIIRDNLVARLILGDVGTSSDTNSNQGSAIKDQGRVMARTVFASLIETPEDEKLSVDANDSSVDEKIRKCYAKLHDNSSDINDLRSVDGIDCFEEKVNNERIFDYKFLVSTIATGMVAWLVLGFCIDVGVRLVKLVFLQIIAPIPITAYVSGGKDNTFNKWTKMCISTYVSVFVKLIIVYFVIYVFSILNVSNLEHISSGQGGVSGLAMVAIILGLLVFAKNAPKLIGDLFGVKMDEESGFKGIAKTALLGGATTVAAGAAGGLSNLGRGIGNTVDAVKKARENGGTGVGAGLRSAFGTVGSIIGGTASGAFHGGQNGFKKNATFGAAFGKALNTSRTNRENRSDRAKVYGNSAKAAWYNLVGDRALGFAGIDTQAKKESNRLKNIGASISRAKSNVGYAQNEVAQGLAPARLQALTQYSYNDFDKLWTKTDASGKVTEFRGSDGKGLDLSSVMAAEGITDANEQQYLKYTEQDAKLEKRQIENNKLQQKAETQQKRMEGQNGKKE